MAMIHMYNVVFSQNSQKWEVDHKFTTDDLAREWPEPIFYGLGERKPDLWAWLIFFGCFRTQAEAERARDYMELQAPAYPTKAQKLLSDLNELERQVPILSRNYKLRYALIEQSAKEHKAWLSGAYVAALA